MIDAKLLEMLVCPVTKGSLEYDKNGDRLISRSAKLIYPIVDGIPVLLEEQAEPLVEDE